MATLEIKDGNLIVHIHGWDRLLALRSTLTVPLAEVKGAVAQPADAKFDEMKGLRLAGGYWPGGFAAGYFWITGGAQGTQAAGLEKLEQALHELEGGDNADFASARAHVEQAITSTKKGLVAAGSPEKAKYLAFYDVHDPARCVAIDCEHGKLRRVVIQLDDEAPEAAVARIQAAIKG